MASRKQTSMQTCNTAKSTEHAKQTPNLPQPIDKGLQLTNQIQQVNLRRESTYKFSMHTTNLKLKPKHIQQLSECTLKQNTWDI